MAVMTLAIVRASSTVLCMPESLKQPVSGVISVDRMSRPRMAKADLLQKETDCWKADIGRALREAVDTLGWSPKEFAAKVNRDPSQARRWLEGLERPQLDVLFAIPDLRLPFVVAMARVAQRAGDDIALETTIVIKQRSA